MKKLIPFSYKVLPLALILILALAVLSPQAVSAQTGAPAPGADTVQVVTDPKLGPILVGGNGMTLYVFAIDKPNVSNCSGACLTAWPALTVATGSQPTAGAGVTGKLGTFTRSEGATQVTINGSPLYFFIADKKPGDTTGQGVNNFGGLWWTVKPDGTPNSSS